MIIIKFIILLLTILFIHYKIKKRIEIEDTNNENPCEIDITPQINNILNRNKICLNGKWNYIIDVQEVGYYNYRMNPIKNGFFKNKKPKNPQELIEYDFDKSPKMEIPSDWNTKDEKLFFYEGTVWFKKSFNYNKKSEKKAFLYFGAVNYEAIVYVNKNLVGRHIGGFTPFNFDITDKLNEGENYIVIKVNNQRKSENIPSLIFDWWNYGGITRDVYIIETKNIFIQYYSLFLDKKEIKGPYNILFNAELNLNISDKIIEVSIPELKIKTKFTSLNGKFFGIIKVNDIILWSPEKPKLYNINLMFENKISIF
jgi:beta-glucuronidase